MKLIEAATAVNDRDGAFVGINVLTGLSIITVARHDATEVEFEGPAQ